MVRIRAYSFVLSIPILLVMANLIWSLVDTGGGKVGLAAPFRLARQIGEMILG